MNKKDENNAQAWDALCRKCAQCCYEKVDFEGRIYYTDMPCQYLDLETRLCRVYAERDTRRPGCARLTKENVGKGFLPADCPYVADLKNYVAPCMVDDDTEES